MTSVLLTILNHLFGMPTIQHKCELSHFASAMLNADQN